MVQLVIMSRSQREPMSVSLMKRCARCGARLGADNLSKASKADMGLDL